MKTLTKQELKKTLELHKLWLESDGTEGKKAHFIATSLEGADLAGADLRQINFYKANLRNADLRGADLSDAYFEDANVEGANFDKAMISGNNFSLITKILEQGSRNL